MKAVIQRVNSSKVSIENKTIGRIETGLTVLLGVSKGDNDSDIDYIVRKISNMRIFEDHENKMNRSVKDINGNILLVSQFTLCGDARKGNRPSFIEAEDPKIAMELYEKTIKKLEQEGLHVETGEFQAHMILEISNDGPVTILLDSRKAF